ncbi:trypsin-like peptidase domain-containing protein [Arthrobacter sp. R1-13]
MSPFPRVATSMFFRSCLAGLAALTIASLCACTGMEGSPDPGPSSPAVTGQTPSPSPSPGSNQQGNQQGGQHLDITRIVEELAPSVVTIFAGEGVGSGVVYDGEGLILTNEHVVRGSPEVEVGFADGQRVRGAVRAADPISDLALVQTDRTGLPVPEFQKELPRVGETAVVIGSPLGFESTVTAGIISGLHRSIPGSAASSQSLVDLIQTDAPISPGNSGGAVVNSRGQVIGISEAYIPPQAGAVALGFAIPAATAVEVAEQLKETGRAEHAFIGLTPGQLTPQIAERLGIQDINGVLVMSIANGGPADDAGIEPGDVLLSLEGKELSAPEDLLAALRGLDPGQTVTVSFNRDNQGQEAKVQLSERPTE